MVIPKLVDSETFAIIRYGGMIEIRIFSTKIKQPHFPLEKGTVNLMIGEVPAFFTCFSSTMCVEDIFEN
jgi:hypothetical protein